MNVTMLAGAVVGILVGLLVVAVIMIVTKKDRRIKCKYDERQELIRGKGFKVSFFTLLLYNGLYAVMGTVVEKPVMDQFTAMLLGICIAITVYAVYCIWNEAYFSLNEKPGAVLVAFAMIAFVNLTIGIINLLHGALVTNGMLNFRSTNLMCGSMFFFIFFALLIKKMKRDREVE